MKQIRAAIVVSVLLTVGLAIAFSISHFHSFVASARAAGGVVKDPGGTAPDEARNVA